MGEAKSAEGCGISVYHHPNLQIRSFLVEEAISNPVVQSFRAPYSAGDSRELGLLGSVGRQVVTEIMNLPGILEIRIKPKEVRIIKKEGTGWEELEPAIIKTLSSALRRKRLRRVK